MLQQPVGNDLVLATGRTETVRTFIELAAEALNFSIAWEGQGVDLRGIDKKSGKVIIKVNPDYYRPAEVDLLVGDSSKAKRVLGWEPTMALSQLVTMMAEADSRRVRDRELVF